MTLMTIAGPVILSLLTTVAAVAVLFRRYRRAKKRKAYQASRRMTNYDAALQAKADIQAAELQARLLEDEATTLRGQVQALERAAAQRDGELAQVCRLNVDLFEANEQQSRELTAYRDADTESHQADDLWQSWHSGDYVEM